MVDRLSKLVAIFEGLDFGRNRGQGDDLLGGACENRGFTAAADFKSHVRAEVLAAAGA